MTTTREAGQVERLYQYLQVQSCFCEDRQFLQGLSSFPNWLLAESSQEYVGQCNPARPSTVKKRTLRSIVDKEEPKMPGGPNRGTVSEDNVLLSDRALLCLTVGRTLYEATYCACVQQLQVDLVKNGSLIVQLSQMLSSSRRLVAFMASKMAVAVLISSTVHKDVIVSFLEHHLQLAVRNIQTFMRQIEQDAHNPVCEVNHEVISFDLCRLLLTRVHELKNGNRCKQENEENLRAYKIDVTWLICRHLPDGLRAFVSCPTAESNKVTEIGSTKYQRLVLSSLLDLVDTLVHVAQDQCNKHLPKLVLLLVSELLQKYCQDLVLLKKILDIVVLFLDQSAPLWRQSRRSQTRMLSQHNDIVITVAMAFIKIVVDSNLVDCIPKKTGRVGFGGDSFLSSSVNNSPEDLGDCSVPRKICTATLAAMTVLIEDKKNMKTADMLQCLHTLYTYVCTTLSLDEKVSSAWLFRLFAEQDDSLVWSMLCTLHLHRAVTDPLLVKLIDPHAIFDQFLVTISHDPSVLLDLLISSETLFLDYLVQYLHSVINGWDSFCTYHQRTKFSEEDKSGPGEICQTQHLVLPNIEKLSDVREDKVLEMNCSGSARKNTLKILDAGALAATAQIENLTKLTSQPEPKTCQTRESGAESNLLLNRDTVIDQPKGKLIKQTSFYLEDIMTTLIRLRFLIERIRDINLFPYLVSPLVRLLTTIEDKYEAMEEEIC